MRIFQSCTTTEQRQGTILPYSHVLQSYCLLGLFGLSAFAICPAGKRNWRKKVYGANVSTIVALLSKDF